MKRYVRYIDIFTLATISALVLFTPLAFGAVHIWAYTIMELSIFGLLLLWSLKHFLLWRHKDSIKIEIPFAKVNIVLALFLVLIFIQMVPIPSEIMRSLFPKRYDFYMSILPSFEGARSISIYTHQTRVELFKFISYIGMFFLALSILDSRDRIKKVVLMVVIAGIIEAFLGIFQMLTKSNGIFWFWHSAYKRSGYFGSFVNPNHFATYMGMVTCMGIGLLISRPRISFSSSNENWRHYLSEFEAYISKNILLIFLLTIMGTSIFLSLSRGGILCFLFTLVFIFILQGFRASRKKRIVIVITGLIFAFLIWIGIDPIIKELSTLFKLTRASPDRPIAWKDSFRIIKDYPLMGVGWGNFRNIFPLYKSPMLHSFWYHAHNEYVEYLVDVGIIGFVLFYGCLFSCLFIIIKRWFRRTEVFSIGITLGGISAILLLLMSNMVTFNLHIPCIAFLFFLVLAIIMRSVYLYHHIPLKTIVLKKRKAGIILGLFSLFILFVFISQMHIFQARAIYHQYQNTKDLYFLKKAIELDPSNAGYRYILAQEYFKDIENHGDDALRLSLSAVQLNPTNPWYHIGLAWISYRLGRTSISPKRELSIALRLDPTNPRIKAYIKKWGNYVLF